MSTPQPLRLLLAEDSPADAELLLRSLRDAGYEPDVTIVADEARFIAGLDRLPQLIVTDYSLPQFNGLRAIELAHALRPEIPVIVVTGVLGDEGAAECIKHGAVDYLLKDRLARLGPAVSQALRLARLTSAVMETTLEAVFVCDNEGRIVRANGPAKLLGTGKVVGEPFARAIRLQPASGIRLPDTIPLGLKTTLHAAEAVLAQPSGRRQVLVSATALDATDPEQAAIVTLTDVTDLRHLERINESEGRFRNLFNISPIPNLIIDSDSSRVLDVNAAFARATGYESAQAVGRTPVELGIPADPGNWETITQRLRDRLPVVGMDVAFRTRSGQDRVGAASAAVLETREKSLYLLAIVDITDRKRSEEALASAKAIAITANKAKSEFLSRISHELRTPLNVVLGFAQVLQMGTLEEAQAEAVGYIVDAGRHLLELIEEVLDISRIESGRMRVTVEPVELLPLVEETIQLMRPLADERGVSIQVEPPSSSLDCWVLADRQRLKQVLLNLFSNAIKFNRKGGTVTVARENRTRGRTAVSVNDTGQGIPQDRMPLLFQAFERLGAEATNVPGTGLGLALSQRLLQAMGGLISAESTPGVGSTFLFELPSALPQRRPFRHAGGTVARESHAPGARTVLYIEDNVASFSLVEHVLKRWPAVRLLSAMQGQMGLDLAQQYRPDLILLDLHLPDLAGEQVLQKLKADPATANIPVIIASADATPSQAERLKAAGALEYLTKPLDISRLLRLVGDVLKSDPAAPTRESTPTAADPNSTFR